MGNGSEIRRVNSRPCSQPMRERCGCGREHESKCTRKSRRLATWNERFDASPSAFEVRRTYADVLHRLGHVQKAIDEYEQLHTRRPDDERVIPRAVQCWQEQAQLKDARELLDGLLDRQPDLVTALIERGRSALRLGDPQSAEKSLRRAVEISPDHADANFVLRLALKRSTKSMPRWMPASIRTIVAKRK